MVFYLILMTEQCLIRVKSVVGEFPKSRSRKSSARSVSGT